jgi:hypothetical protein
VDIVQCIFIKYSVVYIVQCFYVQRYTVVYKVQCIYIKYSVVYIVQCIYIQRYTVVYKVQCIYVQRYTVVYIVQCISRCILQCRLCSVYIVQCIYVQRYTVVYIVQCIYVQRYTVVYIVQCIYIQCSGRAVDIVQYLRTVWSVGLPHVPLWHAPLLPSSTPSNLPCAHTV